MIDVGFSRAPYLGAVPTSPIPREAQEKSEKAVDHITLGSPSRAPSLEVLSPTVENAAAVTVKDKQAPSVSPSPLQPLLLTEIETPVAQPPAEVRPDYRLPTTVIPTMYDVSVEVDPEKPTFTGQVKISTLNKEASDSLVLHSDKIAIESAVARHDGEEYPATMSYDQETQRTTFHFDRNLPVGSVELDIKYQGERRGDLKGVYLATDGNETAIATQGEPAAARSIFPCFDEPEFKAPLKWTITTNPKYTVVTNNPLVKSVPLRDGRVQHQFAASRKPLTTYVAAFTIGQFDATEPEMVAGVPTRVLVGKGKLEQARYAQEVTRNILPKLSEYFDQPYPFAKLDQVAIPGFDAGAMENVGAIFYRQSLLQVDDTTSISGKKDVANVIAHENCHQWFGNLVSPTWWDDLWLNEAFATWHAAKMVDQWKPEWKVWDDFVVHDRAAGMKADALASTHPIYSEVKNPDEANQNFDVITYQKGASILRMVEAYLGEDKFREGLRSYMREKADSNATSDDLWKALDKAAPGSRASEVMKNWVGQEGFPLVTTSLEGNTLTVSQSRFHADPKNAKDGDAKQTWLVPLVIRYQDSEGVKTFKTLLSEKSAQVDIPAVGELKWAYPNAGVSGFYRTEMAPENLDSVLQTGLESLSATEKVNLLGDQWELAKIGQTPMGPFLDSLQALSKDTSRLVVNAVCDYANTLEGMVKVGDREGFADFASGLLSSHQQRLLNATDLSDDEKETKARVLGVMANICKDPTAIDVLLKAAADERKDAGSVDPALASAGLRTLAAQGDSSTLGEMVATYEQRRAANASPSTLERYLSAMTQFEDPQILDRVTGMVTGLPKPGDSFVYPQDQLAFNVRSLLANRKGQEATWTFMKDNWDAVRARAGELSVSNVVEALAALPADKAPEIKAFFEAHPVPEAARSVTKALESLELKGALLERAQPQLGDWLRKRS